jgi:hypothetical protein
METEGLNSATVFYALAILSLPEFYVIRMFVRAWQRLQECRASRSRLDAFFAWPEPPPPPAEQWQALSGSGGDGGGGGGASDTDPPRGAVDLRGGRLCWPTAASATSGESGGSSRPGVVVVTGDDGLGDPADDVDGSITTDGTFSTTDGSRLLPVQQSVGGVAALQNVQLQLRPGELLGVCGSTGSGKTSLLACLLGELHELDAELEDYTHNEDEEGRAAAAAAGGGGGGAEAAKAGCAGSGCTHAAAERVLVAGRTSFVSQQPWVAFGTLRENVMMGAPPRMTQSSSGRQQGAAQGMQRRPGGLKGGEAAFYNKCVESCALTNDLLTLTAGEGRLKLVGWCRAVFAVGL